MSPPVDQPRHNGAAVTDRLLGIVREACAARGVDAYGARLIHHYSNAVFLLPNAGAVARVTRARDSHSYVQRSQEVTQWLVEKRRFDATAPLPGTGVVHIDEITTVSFWVNYPQPEPTEPFTSAHLGSLLRRLHHTGPCSVELPQWVPLSSLQATVEDPHLSRVLADADREWLLQRIHQVRAEVTRLDSPLGHGLIHGDAWAGNLLWNTTTTPYRPVLGDWDRVCHGPREVDLVPTWHAATRYGKGPSWTRAFVDQYGHDLTYWSGLPILLRMRDLVQLTGPIRRAPHAVGYRQALRQRLNGIRQGDTTEVWTAL